MPALYGRVGITQPPTAITWKPQRAGFAEIYKYLPSHRSRHTFLARLRPIFCLPLCPVLIARRWSWFLCNENAKNWSFLIFWRPKKLGCKKSIALDEWSYRKRATRTVPAIIDYCLSLILRARFFFFAWMRPGWEIASLPVAIFDGKWLWICYCKNGSSFTEHSNRLTGRLAELS